MIEMILDLNEDLWAAPKVNIYQLQAKDFAKWLRKQARAHGRKAVIATVQYTAIEIWLQELGLIGVEFLSGGEIRIGEEIKVSNWQNAGYYMFDENGNMELTIGKWLEIISYEDPEDYLVSRFIA